MDPLTQGVIGALAAQASAKATRLAAAAVAGALAGMAADLDVFIRSTTDPLLVLAYHRQFTHSLLFIPVGGLLCAAFCYFFWGRKHATPFRLWWLWCTLGYATHGLLDGCTSYGTQLFWPFSNQRISWNVISVIDPLFTLPLLACVVIALWRANRAWLVGGILWACCYLLLGVLQHHRALNAGYALAQARGHEPVRLHTKPSFANLLVWKTVYQTPERFYVDAVRPGFAGIQVWPGESVAILDVRQDFPWLAADTQQAKDIERFRWFSAGFVAVDPSNPLRVIDVRYSLLPNQINALWGITLDPAAPADEHVRFNSTRERSDEAAGRLWQMITGQ